MTLHSLKKVITGKAYLQWILFISCVGILLFVFAYPGLNDAFLSDDYDWIQNAQHAVDAGDWSAPFTIETGGHFYRPIVAIGFQIDFALGEFNPIPYHLHQLFIHLLLVVGIAFLVSRLFDDTRIGFASGFVFSLFPNHHEVITWLAGRPDLYATAFIVWAAALFAYFLQQRSWAAYTLSLVCGVLAMLSKETALALPGFIVLVLLIVRPLKPIRPLVRDVLFALPWLAVLAIIFYVRNQVISDALGGYLAAGQRQAVDLAGGSPQQILLSLFNVVNWSYLSELMGQNIFFKGAQKAWSFLIDYAWITTILSIGAGYVLVRKAGMRRKKIVMFSLFWILLAFIPVYSLTDEISTHRLVASRLFFLASVGYAMLIAALVLPHSQSGKKFAAARWSVALLFVLLFSALWYLNSIPWHSASKQVQDVQVSLTEYTDKNPLASEDVLIVDSLPDIVHGAYAFFGRHAVTGLLSMNTKTNGLRAYQTNGTQYSDSPFCSCGSQSVRVLRWNGSTRSFTDTTELEARMESAAETCSLSGLTWDFTDENSPTDWNIHDLEYRQTSNGMRITVPETSNGYIETPNLHNLFAAGARTITIEFISNDTISSQEKAIIAWKTEKGFSVNQQIGFPYEISSESMELHIPVCEFMNWTASGDVEQLRMRPLSGGTITIRRITIH